MASADITVDGERKHLETLFQNRINFYLVFASVFIAAMAHLKEGSIRVLAFSTMTIVSILLSLAIIRTYRLVGLAFREIKKDASHPYTRYQKQVRFPGNSNIYLVSIPIVLTVFFLIATWQSYLAL